MTHPKVTRRIRIALLTAAVGGAVAISPTIAQQAERGQPEQEVNPEALSPGDLARMMGGRPGGNANGKKDFPAFTEVSEGFRQVVSTADGQSFYNLWVRDKDGQMLAELPRGFEGRKQFIAMTIGGGDVYAGLQQGDIYCYWKRFDNRLALMAPQIQTKSTGDAESQQSVQRLFTDRVILDVPIVAMGPNNQPVIDFDDLLLGSAGTFFGGSARGLNRNLATVAKAKAFPQNVEVAFEAPVAGGQLRTFHYSISDIPARTGYKPREADPRVGYFTTVHLDLGEFDRDRTWKRFINRWHLEKRDPKLSLSPPKEPIVFYVDSATPVRYRRWVKQGIEYWNDAFREVGIEGAIQVHFQDASTGAHMEKDPEDVRYNFIRWLSNNQGTAIGPSRVHPETGQILDADIVLTDGFIRGFHTRFHDILPELAMENLTPETMAWLEQNPAWDPRVRLCHPGERDRMLAERQARGPLAHGGHPAAHIDHDLLGDDMYDGLGDRVSQVNGFCMAAHGKALQMSVLRMHLELLEGLEELEGNTAAPAQASEGEGQIPPEILEMIRKQLEQNPALLDEIPAHVKAKLGYGEPPHECGEECDGDCEECEGEECACEHGEEAEKDEKKARKSDANLVKGFEGDMLDGMPEKYVGPLLADLVAHEVGHTLGLRHNFRASSIQTLDEINSAEYKGSKTWGASVMDYNGSNIRVESGELQGDISMTHIGPYDKWAIQYGYGSGDPKEVASNGDKSVRPYATDEDTWGPDPLAQRWDLGADPINYAKEKVRLAQFHRARLLDKFVKDGESWSRARTGYNLTLSQQLGGISMMAKWIGGSYVHRDLKGEPDARPPVVPAEADKQREALAFICENAFRDEAFGLTPELLRHMTNDRWWDAGGMSAIFDDPAWPVHERIMGIQASSLTMVLNPTTLGRVYDNEFRVGADEDALTLPELIDTLYDEIFSELNARPNGKYSAREPMISSLRRNLQRETVDRLVDLSFGRGSGASRQAVANLATMKLRQLSSAIDGLIKDPAKLDPYTLSHLSETRIRIDKALDAQYIYNTGDIRVSMPSFGFFGAEGEQRNGR